MASSVRSVREPVIPTRELSEAAGHLLHQMPDEEARFALIDRVSGSTINLDLPPEIYGIIRDVLSALARNQAVSVLPTALELTTNQTADILNVSRGYILRLISEGALPFRMVGTHRRVRLEDVLSYRSQMRQRTTKAIDEIARVDQELGLDD